MKIGFTGTQSGMTPFQRAGLRDVLELFKCTEFCHGDCIGADKEANQIALDFGVKIFTIFPPLDGKKRGWAFNEGHHRNTFEWQVIEEIQVRWMPMDSYLNRNKHIVDNVERLIAAPKEHTHTLRSGTWATIRYAWKIKKDITIIPPIKDEENENR